MQPPGPINAGVYPMPKPPANPAITPEENPNVGPNPHLKKPEQEFKPNPWTGVLAGLSNMGKHLTPHDPYKPAPGLGIRLSQAMAGFNEGQKASVGQQERQHYLKGLTSDQQKRFKLGGWNAIQPDFAPRKAMTKSNFVRVPKKGGGFIWMPAGNAAGMDAPAPKAGTTVNVGGSTQQSAMEKELGKKRATNFTTREENAIAASGNLQNLNDLDALLNAGVQTGFGQPFIDGAKRLALQVGIDVDPRLMAGQEGFQAITNQMILPLVKQLGYNPTDADLRFIVQASPELSKTVEGNRMIIAGLRRKAQRDIELAKMQEQYYRKNMSLNGFANHVADFEARNPIFTQEERAAMYRSVNNPNALPQYAPGGQPAPMAAQPHGGVHPGTGLSADQVRKKLLERGMKSTN